MAATVGVAVSAGAAGQPSATPPVTATLLPAVTRPATSTIIALDIGPHLFIDDYLIEASDHVARVVNQPVRVSRKPIITGLNARAGFSNINFTASVLRDPASGLFRMWYVAWARGRSERFTAYVESSDGLNWRLPYLPVAGTFAGPITHVLDDGAEAAPAAQRYKTIVASDEAPLWRGQILYSPDGLNWSAPANDATLPHPYGEIWRPFVAPTTGGYGLLFRWNQPFAWQDAEGITHTNTVRDETFVRLFGAAQSPEFGVVQDPRLIFVPDAGDLGETQFYNASNVVKRGDYYITMLSILRDDLRAPGTPAEVYSPVLDTTAEVYGMGYTVLAWSRDGIHWQRDRHQDPYFEPAPAPEAWDHAHAWITSLVEVDNLVYLYYGGYKYGHKVFFDRQIGVARTIQDRYVARQADSTPGRLRTPLVQFSAEHLTLNANAAGGMIQVQILDISGQPIPGFSLAECEAVSSDDTAAPVNCQGELSTVAGQPVQLEFIIENARLFAFGLEPARP